MGEANENRNRSSNSSSSSTRATMESLSSEINRYPRDLLQRFVSPSDTQEHRALASEGEEVREEIELNLGLSLGGRFGVDKAPKKLTRSSSIAGTIPLVRDHQAFSTPPASYSVLMRTSSLPTETEEEWRKRKEMQSLRRMEAKRRRSEKQKNLNANLRGEVNLEEERRELNVGRRSWVPTWSRQGAIGALNVRSSNLQGLVGQQQGSQGSVESQGGSSSGMSEMENKHVQGSSSGGEARSPASNQSFSELHNQDVVGSSGTKTSENASRSSRTEMENLSKKLDSVEKREKEVGTNPTEDMPCVFTKGDGPNGRRVDGILYKYGKGEEVRIMCICHGNFHSPAEFVRHAGGGDVDHPLRHIVVNPSGPSL